MATQVSAQQPNHLQKQAGKAAEVETVISVPFNPGDKGDHRQIQINLKAAEEGISLARAGINGGIRIQSSYTPQESEANKLLQHGLNKAFEKLGAFRIEPSANESPRERHDREDAQKFIEKLGQRRVKVDGILRTGGSTMEAVEDFITLENLRRKFDKTSIGYSDAKYSIPSEKPFGRDAVTVGPTTLAALGRYEEHLGRPAYSALKSADPATLAALRPLQANEPPKPKGSNDWHSNPEITVPFNRIVEIASEGALRAPKSGYPAEWQQQVIELVNNDRSSWSRRTRISTQSNRLIQMAAENELAGKPVSFPPPPILPARK